MNRSVHSFITAAITASFLTIPAGCMSSLSYRSPLPEETRRTVQAVAVVPASIIPNNNFSTFAKGRDAGFGNGLGSGAAAGALGGAQVAAGTGIAAVYFLPIFTATGAVVGAVVGGISGAANAVPRDDTQKIENLISNAIAELDVQNKLAEHVVSSGTSLTGHGFTLIKGVGPSLREKKPENRSFDATSVLATSSAVSTSGKPSLQEEKPDYRFLSQQGFNLVIEMNVKTLGFSGGTGSDPSISFFMTANSRVVRLSDGAELYSGVTRYESRPHKANEWARDNAAPLQREFEIAYASLAESTIENIFFVHDFYMSTATQFYLEGRLTEDTACMLKPFSPLARSEGVSLQPIFRWEAFPRYKDQQFDKSGILKRVSDITYDLKLWKGRGGYPDELIYERRGMAVSEGEREIKVPQTQVSNTGQITSAPPIVRKEKFAEHKIEIQLEPTTEYFWTVRARFKLDGQSRLTKWAYLRHWDPKTGDTCTWAYVPITSYYRFVTPKQ